MGSDGVAAVARMASGCSGDGGDEAAAALMARMAIDSSLVYSNCSIFFIYVPIYLFFSENFFFVRGVHWFVFWGESLVPGILTSQSKSYEEFARPWSIVCSLDHTSLRRWESSALE